MKLTSTLNDLAGTLLKPLGKAAFIKTIAPNGRVLDVGCGNNSPRYTKERRPDLHYIGLDVGIYNQSEDFERYTEGMVIASPENFHTEIETFKDAFDAVICAHNLEHCLYPDKVLRAIIQSLRINGRVYLAFPSEQSVNFPSRNGTLNYYDDPTHQAVPGHDAVIAFLKANGIVIEHDKRQYRPLVLSVMGFLLEPLSKRTKKILPHGATWAYYGFETIIIGRKAAASPGIKPGVVMQTSAVSLQEGEMGAKQAYG